MIELDIKLNEALKNIWTNDKYKDFCLYKPVAPKHLINGSILFIGINPSRANTETINQNIIERSQTSFYSLTQESGHKYFNKFVDIANEIGIKWTHFDLLFFQETNQNFIKKILKTPNGKEFIAQQLLLSKDIFNSCAPRIIVVNNSLARDFMKNEMDLKFNWSEELGTELYNNTPIFFTSMLTGQRALDNGSYKRLIWHIKYVLKNNNYR